MNEGETECTWKALNRMNTVGVWTQKTEEADGEKLEGEAEVCTVGSRHQSLPTSGLCSTGTYVGDSRKPLGKVVERSVDVKPRDVEPPEAREALPEDKQHPQERPLL